METTIPVRDLEIKFVKPVIRKELLNLLLLLLIVILLLVQFIFLIFLISIKVTSI